MSQSAHQCSGQKSSEEKIILTKSFSNTMTFKVLIKWIKKNEL